MSTENELPNVLVHVPPLPKEADETLPELIESLRTEAVDGLVLDFYRTSRLVSRVHSPEEAEHYGNRELDRNRFLDLHERFDTDDFDVLGRLYDPELVSWYAEETTASSLQIHPGDITYKRLLESVAEVPQDVLLGVKAAERSTIDRALEWLQGSGDLLLIHEEYGAGDIRSDRYQALSGLSNGKGIADPSGDPDRTRSILSASGEVPSLWQPRLSPDGQSNGYTVESIRNLAGELKQARSDSSKPPGSSESDETVWSLTDRDRSFQRTHRRSLMADRHLSAGSALTLEMVRELRPGKGLPAEEINTLEGIRIQRPTEPQEMISY